MKQSAYILAIGVFAYSAVVLTAAVATEADSDNDAVSAQHYESPADNRADEALAEQFAYDQAVRFADNAAMDWQDTYRCVTCHTNGLYLLARPAAGTDAPAYRDARDFTDDYLRRYVVDGEPSRGQHGSDEGLVATTAFKAISDIQTLGRLEESTTAALDHIWTLQDDSGSWVQWLKCNWGPYESDDHFGVTLVTLAMGMAGDDPYAQTPAALAGVNKLHAYLENNPPGNLHQAGMTLWASMHADDLADNRTRRRWVRALLAAQRADGGWAMADLGGGDWLREDGTAQDDHSDAYATAFVAHVLIEAGRPRDAGPVARAIDWLKQHQRESGRWYTRSPRRDRRHYISHAATNFALMVLAEELPPNTPDSASP